MRTFCTIITRNYLPFAITLYRSLMKLNSNETLQVLVVDEKDPLPAVRDCPGLRFVSISDIYQFRNADLIFSKYTDSDSDALRWALKPVFISYLLKTNFKKVLYTDCDIFFFNSYEFLFKELDDHPVILTPGGTTRNPLQHEEEFLSGFRYGLFNAGFLGAGSAGTPVLDWWSDCCAYKVEASFASGLFVDQKYLDALPVLFENIGIIKHKGCNIAFWNQHEHKRIQVKDQLLINGKFPVVFIHFTNKYIPELLSGNDPLVYPYFLEYRKMFEGSGAQLNQFIPGMPEYKPLSLPLRIKHKLLIRTRIKRFLYRLSQKK